MERVAVRELEAVERDLDFRTSQLDAAALDRSRLIVRVEQLEGAIRDHQAAVDLAASTEQVHEADERLWRLL